MVPESVRNPRAVFFAAAVLREILPDCLQNTIAADLFKEIIDGPFFFDVCIRALPTGAED